MRDELCLWEPLAGLLFLSANQLSEGIRTLCMQRALQLLNQICEGPRRGPRPLVLVQCHRSFPRLRRRSKIRRIYFNDI
jgi:hypothetical protein